MFKELIIYCPYWKNTFFNLSKRYAGMFPLFVQEAIISRKLELQVYEKYKTIKLPPSLSCEQLRDIELYKALERLYDPFLMNYITNEPDFFLLSSEEIYDLYYMPRNEIIKKYNEFNSNLSK